MHPAHLREAARALVTTGYPDAEVARRTGLPRTTVRDLRRAGQPLICPRCWRRMRPTRWTAGDYAFLLGLYLGDGCISSAGRTYRMRISLDARHPRVIADARAVLETVFVGNRIGRVEADNGATVVLSLYSSHLPCLFPQHGRGHKHERTIALEPWQRDLVSAAPFQFLRGCIWSDGCMFVNRTGRYEYLTADFCNFSADIRALFKWACEAAGLEYRANRDRVRINRRQSVERLVAEIGTKR